MVDQVTYWIFLVSVGADVLLLLRLLMLRLHRVYTFVALYCVVTVVLDAGYLITGLHGPASDRLFIYSRFVEAFLFPLAAWDVFEEIQEQTAKFRRLNVIRLISGLTIGVLFALVISALAPSDDATSGMSDGLVDSAILLWAATASTSCLFMWNMRRLTREQQIAMPGNSRVLWLFFFIVMICELAQALEVFLGSLLTAVLPALEIAFGAFDIAIVLWCTIRLRRVTSDAPAQQSQGVS